ncbi:hypothetical protein D3C85_1687560 [compost metagenome]
MHRQLLANANQFKDWRGHDLTLVGGHGVEALDVRITAVGRHLPVDIREDFLDCLPNLDRIGKIGVTDVFDRVRAAHGRAAEAFHSAAVAAAGQPSYQR